MYIDLSIVLMGMSYKYKGSSKKNCTLEGDIVETSGLAHIDQHIFSDFLIFENFQKCFVLFVFWGFVCFSFLIHYKSVDTKKCKISCLNKTFKCEGKI